MTVITLSYSNGKPFALEKFALHPEGTDKPALTGYTDSAGRIFFDPGSTTRWRLKAAGNHGHGLVRDLEITPSTPVRTEAVEKPPTPESIPKIQTGENAPNQASIALFGLSLIIGGFGALQLFARKRKS